MISFNGFLDPKYSPLLRSMKKKYKPQTRPIPKNTNGSLGQYKSNIRIGSIVLVAEKENYRTGLLTRGQVIKILTPREYHPRGIKVLLDSGRIGRVQQILVY